MTKVERAPDTRNRAEEARKRLGVTKEQLDGCRKITPALKESGLTKERVIEILEGDESPDARLFVAKYRSISESDLAYISIEEISLSCGLSTRRLWEVIAGARLEQSQETVKLMVAEAQPRIFASVIKAATEAQPIIARDEDGESRVVGWTNGDIKAAELIWKGTGFLPTPKGATTILNIGGEQRSAPQDEPDEVPLQDMDSCLKQIQQAITKPQLEAPKQTPQLVEAEYEEVPIVR